MVVEARFIPGVLICLFILFSPFYCGGEENGGNLAAVIISKEIRPYVEALSGVREICDENGLGLKEFRLNEYPGDARRTVERWVADNEPVVIITIGPEALSFAAPVAKKNELALIYSVVLNPGRISVESKAYCGISLVIPAKLQLDEIRSYLPDVRRIGVIFDPAYNVSFFDNLASVSGALGIEVVPLTVSSRKDIPGVLEKNWTGIDVIWLIPDHTVISERVVQYIIRRSISRLKPVIGFNRFFHESGAVLSFEFDYRELGRQAGRLVVNSLLMGHCSSVQPAYGVLINEKVAKKLRVRVVGLNKKEVSP